MARTRKDGKNYGKHNRKYRESGRYPFPYERYDLGEDCGENGKPTRGDACLGDPRARKFCKRQVARARRRICKKLLVKEQYLRQNILNK